MSASVASLRCTAITTLLKGSSAWSSSRASRQKSASEIISRTWAAFLPLMRGAVPILRRFSSSVSSARNASSNWTTEVRESCTEVKRVVLGDTTSVWMLAALAASRSTACGWWLARM